MQNIEKMAKPTLVLWKSCGVHTARFLKYVWAFFNIMYDKVNGISTFLHRFANVKSQSNIYLLNLNKWWGNICSMLEIDASEGSIYHYVGSLI